MADYPVYVKFSNQKLAQLGMDNLEIENSEIENSGIDYVDPAWDYAAIYPELKQAQLSY